MTSTSAVILIFQFSLLSAVISILTSSRRQPGRGRRWRSFQCPGGALANVAGALSAPSLESWSRQVGLVEMCHNTTHRGQQASASGDYLLYTLFPPSHHQSCSVMHFNERRVVFQAHMKGLLTLQYPLLLSACAIEYDLLPPRRFSIFVEVT